MEFLQMLEDKMKEIFLDTPENEHKVDYATLLLCVQLPGICSNLQYSDVKFNQLKDNKKYIKWVVENFSELHSLNILGMSAESISNRLYQLRCKMIHAGNVDAECGIMFVDTGKLSTNILRCNKSGTIVISAASFCIDMLSVAIRCFNRYADKYKIGIMSEEKYNNMLASVDASYKKVWSEYSWAEQELYSIYIKMEVEDKEEVEKFFDAYPDKIYTFDIKTPEEAFRGFYVEEPKLYETYSMRKEEFYKAKKIVDSIYKINAKAVSEIKES